MVAYAVECMEQLLCTRRIAHWARLVQVHGGGDRPLEAIAAFAAVGAKPASLRDLIQYSRGLDPRTTLAAIERIGVSLRTCGCPHLATQLYASAMDVPAVVAGAVGEEVVEEEEVLAEDDMESDAESEDEEPRKIQERKDLTLLMLALEFHKIATEEDRKNKETSETDDSQKSPEALYLQNREKMIDMAFTRMEEIEIDNKSMMQLRYSLQEGLEEQVKDLFDIFCSIDFT